MPRIALATLALAAIACTPVAPEQAAPAATPPPDPPRVPAPAKTAASPPTTPRDLTVTIVRTAHRNSAPRRELVLDARAPDIDPALLARLDAVDLARVPTDHLPCGDDGEFLVLDVRTAAGTRRFHVDERCLYELCDADQRCDAGSAGEWLAARGHAWDAMHALVQLADAIDARARRP